MTPEEMRNYLPLTEPGTVRVRVRSASLDNQFGANPMIVWKREKQIFLADGSYEYVPMLPIATEVTPEMLASQIDLLNVDTGEALGQMQGAAIVLALQSLFVSEDHRQAQVVLETEIPVAAFPGDEGGQDGEAPTGDEVQA